MAYESGTASLGGVATTTGIGYTPGLGAAVSTGVTRLSGQQSSLTAQRTAPPERARPTGCWWLGATTLLGLLALLHVLGLPGALVALVQDPRGALSPLLNWACGAGLSGGGLFVLLRHRARVDRQNAEYPRLYEAWSKSWLCHKCGYFGPLE
ncbi:MAG: hypothetical protein JSR82_20425 [Verrucomicrobia bacterium]|nr:hypothetical protein [Verrucomicrobiota bacterium]